MFVYNFYNDPMKFYNAMLDDIGKAKHYIYLETYRFNNDSIGVKFRDLITKKCREGVEVKLLMDSWGTSLPSSFFAELIKLGGEARYYQKIKFFWDFFTKNHKRNHRKLLIIDDKINYIGSANLTDYSLNWRESVLRIESDIVPHFKKLFLQHYEMYNKYTFEKQFQVRKITHGKFEIIRDIPSLTKQRIRKKYIELIRQASNEVIIETPYFLPSFYIRKALADAVKRGVIVKVVMPRHSDVGLVDILRTRYLGPLHKNGVQLYLYTPHNLHAKLLLVDNQIFSVGSPNFDYRSFRFQHEIILIGENEAISNQIAEHMRETIENSVVFSYKIWKKRSAMHRFIELIIVPFRHLL